MGFFFLRDCLHLGFGCTSSRNLITFLFSFFFVMHQIQIMEKKHIKKFKIYMGGLEKSDIHGEGENWIPSLLSLFATSKLAYYLTNHQHIINKLNLNHVIRECTKEKDVHNFGTTFKHLLILSRSINHFSFIKIIIIIMTGCS